MAEENAGTPIVDAAPAAPAAEPERDFSGPKSKFIAAWEVAGGDMTKIRSSYNPLPHWPEGHSGLTVGFGYDLKYQTQADFRKDWEGKLTPEELARLEDYVPSINAKGKRVPPKKKGNPAAVKATKDIDVRYSEAIKVYEDVTIPKFEARTEKVFPGYSELDPYTQAVLVSMVYNRGDALGKAKTLRRKHFMEIREAVVKKDTKAIAATIKKMKVEHTNKKNKKGLHRRRDGEAAYIEDHQTEIAKFYADQKAAADAAAGATR